MSARDEHANRCISLATIGSLDSLELITAPRPVPGPNQVLIAVSAAALNFKEVLQALGMMPSPSDGGSGRALRFGLECAGTVVACGSAVTGHSIGDEVIALGDSCFSDFMLADGDRVARIPSGWSFADAAAFPIAFLTAYYALFRIGRLRKGERVLIHAATGGVGMAAVQLAQRIGAEIFATAGTEAKRAYLRSIGIAHVLDSRSLAFADEVRARTAGRGVDVVLNSLSGEFIVKGVQSLAPFGRFLELGKRDVYAEMPLNLRLLERGISFSVILFGLDSPDFSELFSETLELCERGELKPLPYSVFPATEATAAFTYMARAAHTGKVLIAFREDATASRASRKASSPATETTTGQSAQVDVSNRLANALPAQDGVAAFAQALASGLSQVIVSTLPLGDRLQNASAPQHPALATVADQKPLAREVPMRVSPRPALRNSYIAPRDAIEQTLCDIWQSFLGIDPIGVEDSFESLGGDSLTAMPLLAKVRAQLQVRLPTYQLLDTPTIAELAQVIAQKPPESSPSAPLPNTIVELRAPVPGQPPRPILFLVHPAGGHVHIYRDLVQALGDDQPVYALQAEGVDGKLEPLKSIEALADSYMQAMRSVQPQGPYAIAGASLGGAVSYEIARRLIEAGQAVRFVALFDTPGPNYLPPIFKDDAEILAYMMHLDGAVEVNAEALRRLSMDEQHQLYFAGSKLMNQMIPELAKDQLRAFLHVFWVQGHALNVYVPQPSSVPVIFFLARDKDPFNSPTPELAWLPLSRGRFDLYEVPGNHITMNRAPHVQRIAERLRQHLAIP